MKKYEAIVIPEGASIEVMVRTLLTKRNAGEPAKCSFRGKEFFSDTISVDGAYKTLFGERKADYIKSTEQKKVAPPVFVPATEETLEDLTSEKDGSNPPDVADSTDEGSTGII